MVILGMLSLHGEVGGSLQSDNMEEGGLPW